MQNTAMNGRSTPPTPRQTPEGFLGLLRRRPGLALSALWAALLAACSSTPLPEWHPPATEGKAPPPDSGVSGATELPQPSQASTPRAYRQDAAAHLYRLNADRIYKGKLPPMLYAIGVLQVHIDRRGQVTGLHWMRAPSQAPEVVAEIERTVRRAAPYPVPARLGQVVYTDTWLWDESGRFQLDTLTEGQRGE